MFHLTVFGGNEVRLTGGSKFIVTLFGGTDVYKSTLARRIIRERERSLRTFEASGSKQHGIGGPDRLSRSVTDKLSPKPRNSSVFLFTMFGAAEIKPPSLAEEFLDMRELMSSGMIKPEEWDHFLSSSFDALDGVSSFTMFGATGEEPLSSDEEINKIRSARELGLLDDDEAHALRSVVGRDPRQVMTLIRQTAMARPRL